MKFKTILKAIFFTTILFFLVSKMIKEPERKIFKDINKLYYSKQYKTVKTELITYLKSHPKSVNSWCYLGRVNIDLQDTTGAKNAYTKALNISPKHYNALMGLGMVYHMYADYKHAKQWYTKAIEIAPLKPEAYSRLMVLELNYKHFNEAIRYGEKAKVLNLIKQEPEILENLAIAYHYTNKIEKRDHLILTLKNLNYRGLKNIKKIIKTGGDIRADL